MPKSILKPLSVTPRLHSKTKLIATLEGKDISEVATELYLPVAQKRADQLLIEAVGKNGKAKR